MTTVDHIKKKCREKGISIAKLERECGFANGYLSNLKRGEPPMDRLLMVAEVLGVQPECFYGKPTPDEPDQYIQALQQIRNNWDQGRFDACYRFIRSLYLQDHPEDAENIFLPD